MRGMKPSGIPQLARPSRYAPATMQRLKSARSRPGPCSWSCRRARLTGGHFASGNIAYYKSTAANAEREVPRHAADCAAEQIMKLVAPEDAPPGAQNSRPREREGQSAR